MVQGESQALACIPERHPGTRARTGHTEWRRTAVAESIQEQLVTYLKDAHALEQMSLQMTQAAAKATDDPQLHQLFEDHHEETRDHERLIRQRIEARGE